MLGNGKEEKAMRLQPGDCYALWSEQIVQLRERLDEYRWMAVMWDRRNATWSQAVYSIDEQLIDSVVRNPQPLSAEVPASSTSRFA